MPCVTTDEATGSLALALLVAKLAPENIAVQQSAGPDNTTHYDFERSDVAQQFRSLARATRPVSPIITGAPAEAEGADEGDGHPRQIQKPVRWI